MLSMIQALSLTCFCQYPNSYEVCKEKIINFWDQPDLTALRSKVQLTELEDAYTLCGCSSSTILAKVCMLVNKNGADGFIEWSACV